MEIPEFINKEDWQGFLTMRKLIKKPLTDNAAKRALKTLERLYEQGEDISLVLNQSEDKCWQGLFAVKESYYAERGIDRTHQKGLALVTKITDRSWSEG